jgi:ABC-type sugar transport system substrate-binding protein
VVIRRVPNAAATAAAAVLAAATAAVAAASTASAAATATFLEDYRLIGFLILGLQHPLTESIRRLVHRNRVMVQP